ncbi:MAG: hypothetical protein JWR80_10048 [Bradyrhizobium sp.]|nr:hypothetical protein [Bradyrhizobium sp.]
MTPALASICAELGITVVPVTRQREVMETFAENTMERILREHGAEHLRSVLLSIVETTNNKRQLVAPVIWGVSDVLLAHPSWFGSAFLEAMDSIDLADMHERAKANRKAAQPRQAIATMLFEELSKTFQVVEQERLI